MLGLLIYDYPTQHLIHRLPNHETLSRGECNEGVGQFLNILNQFGVEDEHLTAEPCQLNHEIIDLLFLRSSLPEGQQLIDHLLAHGQ